MSFNKKEFYITTAAGDVVLVEIVNNSGIITIFMGDIRIDLNSNSALELADTLLILTSENQC